MDGEILLGRKIDEQVPEEEGLFTKLEERVDDLLGQYQKLVKERDHLAMALGSETEKVRRLEKRLEFLTRDREKVKTRIDQLLHRLKGIDV